MYNLSRYFLYITIVLIYYVSVDKGVSSQQRSPIGTTTPGTTTLRATTTRTTTRRTPATRRSTPISSSESQKAFEIAWKKCREYTKYRFRNYTDKGPLIGDKPFNVSEEADCSGNEGYIAGNSKSVNLFEFPFMVMSKTENGDTALLGHDDNITTDLNSWNCGGTLISEQFILSAAHCTKPFIQTEVKWALLGILSREDISATLLNTNLFRINENIIHPEYKANYSTYGYNDIALFKLEKPIELGPAIRPICLAYPNIKTEVDTQATISGWGATGTGLIESTVLLRTVIKVLDTKVCAEQYANDLRAYKNGIDANTMICGGDLSRGDRGNDTCMGDSGGPMLVRVPDYNCTHLQIGIASHGLAFQCGEKSGAIYTRVSYFLPWIQRIVWP